MMSAVAEALDSVCTSEGEREPSSFRHVGRQPDMHKRERLRRLLLRFLDELPEDLTVVELRHGLEDE
jgi:hypothetical protein